MAPDQANTVPRPLAGCRVLDLSLLLPGPYCTWLLAGFGAEVIKVEPPAGDPLRRMSPPLFTLMNRGKRSVTLDLKLDADREALLRLVASADMLIEGFRPGALARMGLSVELLQSRRPSLVVGSISGFGWSGPYRDRAAHDLNFLALAGYFAVPAQLEHVAARPQVRLADMVAGQSAAIALTMAWLQARASGRGSHVDASIFDAIAGWTSPLMLATEPDAAPEQLGHVMADSALYATSDGRHLSFGTLEDKFWQAFVAAVADVAPELGDARFAKRSGRDAHKRELAALLTAAIARRPLADWLARLQGVDTAVAPAYTGHEALQDAQMRARGFVGTAADGLPELHFPALFSGAMPASLGAAPTLGQDNESLLLENRA